MFSVDTLLHDIYPQQLPSVWKRRILKRLLFEKEFNQFALNYPHLKGFDLIEQVMEYFDIRSEFAERDLENIPTQGTSCFSGKSPDWFFGWYRDITSGGYSSSRR